MIFLSCPTERTSFINVPINVFMLRMLSIENQVLLKLQKSFSTGVTHRLLYIYIGSVHIIIYKWSCTNYAALAYAIQKYTYDSVVSLRFYNMKIIRDVNNNFPSFF